MTSRACLPPLEDCHRPRTPWNAVDLREWPPWSCGSRVAAPRYAKTGAAILSDLACRLLREATDRSAQEWVGSRVYDCPAGATAGSTIPSAFASFGLAVLDPLTRA